MKSKFWMVLGSGQPTVRHQSEEAARNEAERLARYTPGVEFFVLQAIASVEKVDIAWTDLSPRTAEEDERVF